MTNTDFKFNTINPKTVTVTNTIRTKDCDELQKLLYQKVVTAVGQLFPIEIVFINNQNILISGACMLAVANTLSLDKIKCIYCDKSSALNLIKTGAYQFKGKEKDMTITAYKVWKGLDKKVKKTLTCELKSNFVRTTEAENTNYIPCYEFIRVVTENPYKSYSAIKQILSAYRKTDKDFQKQCKTVPLTSTTIKPKTIEFANNLNGFLQSPDAEKISNKNLNLLYTLLGCLEQVEAQFE